MTPEQIRQNMLGLSDPLESMCFEHQLAAQPRVAREAASVEPDAFVRKLRRHYGYANVARHHPGFSGTAMNTDKYQALPAGTELESNEEIDRVREELRGRNAGDGITKPAAIPRGEQPYRPTMRPPSAMLIMCDDGETSGEVFRLRSDRFIIGRAEGDLQLPDDEQISTRHVALTRQTVSGQTRWVVTDLQSRNGMFVRVGKAPLTHLSEFLVGGGRYRLDIVQSDVAETAAFGDWTLRAPATRGFDNNFAIGSELLTELVAGGIGTRMVLTRDHYWIGSDSECAVCRPSDPFVSGKHASLTRSPRGTWVIQNNSSINGVWLRMPQVVLEPGRKCEFQIGEQRFRLRYGVPL
jgi:pSer/pThr/pTyr-binding forkhead associated (FHA) protein